MRTCCENGTHADEMAIHVERMRLRRAEDMIARIVTMMDTADVPIPSSGKFLDRVQSVFDTMKRNSLRSAIGTARTATQKLLEPVRRSLTPKDR